MARGYRNAVIKPARKDPNHPINHGFKMQVHHLLSKQGIKDTEKDPIFKSYGYDINKPGNLVALPCTLDGACYLQVQLHRGDHPRVVDTNDKDSEHPDSYHDEVTQLASKAFGTISKRCVDDKNPGIQRYMDYHSLLILRKISSFKLPLTTVARAFQPGRMGCLNASSIPELIIKLKDNPKQHECNGRSHDSYSTFSQVPYILQRGK